MARCCDFLFASLFEESFQVVSNFRFMRARFCFSVFCIDSPHKDGRRRERAKKAMSLATVSVAGNGGAMGLPICLACFSCFKRGLVPLVDLLF